MGAKNLDVPQALGGYFSTALIILALIALAYYLYLMWGARRRGRKSSFRAKRRRPRSRGR
ncbi:MAG: hypothetical protein SF172_04465 [Burkholderiales bacterium]|nr:hypothetical protein [Betaproteobacteria bacterium]MDX2218255.1 hypothetical protein [Burkholderiales bacterium]